MKFAQEPEIANRPGLLMQGPSDDQGVVEVALTLTPPWGLQDLSDAGSGRRLGPTVRAAIGVVCVEPV
ncbi:hypothetical protein KRMM14A1004_60110 [Krasilnikovia sp. MM14-A1004]